MNWNPRSVLTPMFAEIFTAKMNEHCAVCRNEIIRGISAFEPTAAEITLCIPCAVEIGKTASIEAEDMSRKGLDTMETPDAMETPDEE